MSSPSSSHTPLRQVYSLAIPIMLSSVTTVMLNVVDTAMVGHYSATALAAVGFVGVVLGVLSMIIASLGVGLNVYVSQLIGADDKASIGAVLRWSYGLGAVLGVVVCAGVGLCGDWILSLADAPDELLSAGGTYLEVMSWTLLFGVVGGMLRNTVTALGKTKVVFGAALITNVLNVSLDYVLIFGHLGMPEMGVAGAAWASVISALAGFTYIASRVWALRSELLGDDDPVVSKVPSGKAILWRLCKLASPTTVEWGVWSIAMLVVNTMLLPFGVLEVAVFHAGLKIQSVFMLCLGGFSTAAITLTGRAVGAQDVSQVKQWHRLIVTQAVLVVGGCSMLSVIAPRLTLQLFMDAADIANVDFSLTLFFVTAMLLAVVRSINIVSNGSIRGMGDVAYFAKAQPVGLVVMLGACFALLNWAAMGAVGVMLAMLMDEAVRATWACWRIYRGDRVVGPAMQTS